MTNKEKVSEALKQLEAGVKEIVSSEKYQMYLNTMSKFHNYSANNIMMILLQRPEATQVAGMKTWNNMNRRVNKGEKAIKIFAPCIYKQEIENEDGTTEEKESLYFRLVPVFDIDQTNGEDLPTLATKLDGEVDNYSELIAKLETIASVPVRFQTITGSANGYYSETKQEIVIDENLSEQQTVKTLVHEITHSLLHSTDDGLDRNTEEVQAESVAYVVNNYLGIDTSDYSFGYVVGWSKDKEFKELKESLDVIQKTSNQIIKQLER